MCWRGGGRTCCLAMAHGCCGVRARVHASHAASPLPARPPQVDKTVKELVSDVRQVFMPHTADHLRERK